MVFEWATSGPYSGHTVTLVAEHRGYNIYWLSGPSVYGIADPDGNEWGPTGGSMDTLRDYIDDFLGPPVEPPPEPEPEPEGYYDYHSTYRGAVIYVWLPGGTPFRTYFGGVTYSEVSLSELHAAIDASLEPEPPVEPEPDPTAKTFIGTYRDIDIYKLTATGWFTFTYETVEYTIQYWNPTIAKIDELLGALPTPDEYVTTWGGYAIWKRSTDNMFYVMVEGVPQGEFAFLEQAQEYIENVLGGLLDGDPYTPGDDPSYTPMDKDPVRAAAISGPVNTFLSSVGLTPEALDAVVGSGADPEKAAMFAKSVSQASVGAVAILGTIGVVAEVASLGQIETVAQTINMVLEKTGIAGMMEELFRLPFMSALVAPARHYWNSVYTPEVPGIGELVTFLVREVITPEEFEKNVALHGLSKYWADAHWEVHWRLPSIGDIIRAQHLGIITLEERAAYFVLHDYRPDARPGIAVSDLEIYGGLTKTVLGRVDTRRAYQYGYMERPKLIEMYQALGYEEDSELQADIQIRASVDGLQSSIRRNTGMIFRDQLKDARKEESTAVGIILADRNTKLVDLGNATIAGTYTEEEAAVIEADIRAKAEVMIAEVRAKARAREEEVEATYRAALAEVGDLIDPDELWVLRYKLEAARVEVAEEFEIVPPVEVAETAEEPA